MPDSKSIFISYAHEDIDAARRIAEALRGFGMEVFFDENELRGGDSWDEKLRKQIRECILFLPVISALPEPTARVSVPDEPASRRSPSDQPGRRPTRRVVKTCRTLNGGNR